MTSAPIPVFGHQLPVPSDRDVVDTMAAARSDATRRAYHTQWGIFVV